MGSDPVNATDPDGQKTTHPTKPKVEITSRNSDGSFNWRDSNGNTGTYNPKNNTTTIHLPNGSSGLWNGDSRSFVANSSGASVVGDVGKGHEVVTKAAELQAGAKGSIGISVLKGVNAGLTIGSTVLEARAQIQAGKPVDRAIVNSGARGVFAGAVGSIGSLAAPETLGGSLAAAGGAILIDRWTGGAVGNAAERTYVDAIRNADAKYIPPSAYYP